MKKLFFATVLALCGLGAFAQGGLPAPTHDAENVKAIYTDTYGNAPGFFWSDWGGGIGSTYNDDGQDIWHITNFKYFGSQFEMMDVTGYEYFHIDIYPTTATTIGIVPITTQPEGGNSPERGYTTPVLVPNQWNSIDVPMAEMIANGVTNLDRLYQIKYNMKIQGANQWNCDGTVELYIDNVYFYNESANAPKISAEVTDITSESAVLTYDVTFPDNPVIVSVTINGEVAEAGNSLNLTGLDPKTSYTYTIVASCEVDGETYTAEKSVTFMTLRAAGDNPVYYDSFDGIGEKSGVSFNVHVDYSITYNPDKTITVYAEFVGLPSESNHKVSILNVTDEWKEMSGNDEVGYTYTSTGTFEEGQKVEFFFWCEYANGGVFGGAYHKFYTAAAENTKPITAPVVKSAVAQNVTFNSAEIAYELKVPEAFSAADVKTYYKIGETVAEATANPIVLTGLTEHTAYEVEVYAVATLGSDVYESTHKTVSFSTPYADATDLVYADYVKARFVNAFRVGETEADRRVIAASLPFTLTYNTDGHVVYAIDLSEVYDIVGLVPQVWNDGHKNLVEGADHVWSCDLGKKEEGASLNISHYLAYSGGVIDINFGAQYGAVGHEQTLPEIGEAVSFDLYASKSFVKVDEFINLTAIATDAAGYYLPVDQVSYSAPEQVTIAGSKAKAGSKGVYTITATIGAISKSVEVVCGASAGATNVIAGVEAYEHAPCENAITYITDGNEGAPEVIWNCAATEEHYVYLELPEEYDIEAVLPVWEGAYATHYSVILSQDKLTKSGISTLAAGSEPVVISVVDNNTTNPVHVLDIPTNKTKYVGIETTKALNTGWGIKLRELKVYGVEGGTTGVNGVAVETEGQVEYYNLNGMRVQGDLAPGLYIKRQGSKATKVIIR